MFHARKFGVILLALAAPAVAAAESQDSALCTFVKRVLADQPAEFAAFKGALAKNDQYKTMFDGTATPDAKMTCTLHVRRKVGKNVFGPLYGCSRYDLKTKAAKALYVRYTNELKSCFPGAAIIETIPKASDETTTWQWRAKTGDFAVKLEASNGASMLAALVNGRPITDKVKSAMSVSVDIEDLSATRPGASIPEIP